VNAAKALFQPVWVPGQVVVDHQVSAALQVDAFSGGVIGEQCADFAIVVEGGDDGAAAVAGDAAVQLGDVVAAKLVADLVGEVSERIARFAEDQQLAAGAGAPPKGGKHI
jgi:hypothetical protein